MQVAQLQLGFAEKLFRGGRVWPPNPPDIGGAGGVWGFTGFEAANYLIFREKEPKFPPRSRQGLPLFDFKKA